MKFRCHVEPPEPMRGLEVPPEVVAALGGGKRPAVRHAGFNPDHGRPDQTSPPGLTPTDGLRGCQKAQDRRQTLSDRSGARFVGGPVDEPGMVVGAEHHHPAVGRPSARRRSSAYAWNHRPPDRVFASWHGCAIHSRPAAALSNDGPHLPQSRYLAPGGGGSATAARRPLSSTMCLTALGGRQLGWLTETGASIVASGTGRGHDASRGTVNQGPARAARSDDQPIRARTLSNGPGGVDAVVV